MRNETNAAALLCTALLVVLCATPARAASTADELAQLESEHVILKARLRMLETRAQMAARRADIDRYSTTARESAMPTVTGIDGLGDKLQATVLMENGHMADVRQGDTLPNGMKVVSIREDGVTVQTADRKKVRLKPGVEPDPRGPSMRVADLPSPQQQQQLAVMPPMPARPGTAR